MDSKFPNGLEMRLPYVENRGMKCVITKIYHDGNDIMRFLYFFEIGRINYQVNLNILAELNSWFDIKLYDGESIVVDWVKTKIPITEEILKS